MSTNYNEAQIEDKDRLRFEIQDTGKLSTKDESGASVQMWMFTDEEIQAVLDKNGYLLALAIICEAAWIKFASEPDVFDDETGTRFEWKTRFAAWEAKAKSVRDRLRESETSGGKAPEALSGVATAPPGMDQIF